MDDKNRPNFVLLQRMDGFGSNLLSLLCHTVVIEMGCLFDKCSSVTHKPKEECERNISMRGLGFSLSKDELDRLFVLRDKYFAHNDQERIDGSLSFKREDVVYFRQLLAKAKLTIERKTTEKPHQLLDNRILLDGILAVAHLCRLGEEKDHEGYMQEIGRAKFLVRDFMFVDGVKREVWSLAMDGCCPCRSCWNTNEVDGQFLELGGKRYAIRICKDFCLPSPPEPKHTGKMEQGQRCERCGANMIEG
jgi:hypothetical protein